MGESDRCFEPVDRASLRPGLRVDHLGDERLVLDSAAGIVHAVRGPAVAALDQVLSGRRPIDDEVLAALVGAGIAETSGLTRREALALSTSALALIASTTLPSAAAAASTPSLSATDPSSGTVTPYDLQDGARLYRLVNLSFSLAATHYTFTPTAGTTVDVLLVAGGGAGGEPGDRTGVEFFGGGGGGGELAYVSLGVVPAGTELSFQVAGFSAGIGGASILTRGSDSVTAAGGGRGAARIGSTLTAASAGGSGGGGTAGATAGGAAGSGAVSDGLDKTSYANAGGDGTVGHRAAAGGGGAAEAAVGADSTENGGGDGGNGRTLDVTGWILTGSGAPSAQTFGSGGGGAGIATAGVSDVGGEAGRGATTNDAGSFVFAQDGALGTGSGGGGGILLTRSAAFAGFGGSGVIWVRTS